VNRSQKVPRGHPPFADTQRADILRLLREAKGRGDGVRRADLIFQYRYTQCGTRIFELEEQGYEVRHEIEPGQRYVTYFLVSEPEQPKELPRFAPRPSANPQEQTADLQPVQTSESDYMRREREDRERAMPLFAGVWE
jgi:hypothetical protein